MIIMIIIMIIIIIAFGAQANYKSSAGIQIVAQPLKLFPGITQARCFGLQISEPCVLSAASLSLPLWVPGLEV